MSKTFCEPLRSVDKVGYDVCLILKDKDPSLDKHSIDVGVPYIDFSSKSRAKKHTKPDGKVSPQEMRQYALRKVTDEYLVNVDCVDDMASCPDHTSTLLGDVKKAGMTVPWFFYSKKNLTHILKKLAPIRNMWNNTGDVEKTARALYGLIFSPSGLGMKYSDDISMSELTVDDILARKLVRCDELAYLVKGLAMIIGMPPPQIYDSASNYLDVDHIYSSFKLGDGLELFLDPLRKKPFIAKRHDEYDSAILTDDLYLMGVYHMNASARDCEEGDEECNMFHAGSALMYSPTYRNHLLMGIVYNALMDRHRGQLHFVKVCELNPHYFRCK
jgi:hypothetical protein